MRPCGPLPSPWWNTDSPSPVQGFCLIISCLEFKWHSFVFCGRNHSTTVHSFLQVIFLPSSSILFLPPYRCPFIYPWLYRCHIGLIFQLTYSQHVDQLWVHSNPYSAALWSIVLAAALLYFCGWECFLWYLPEYLRYVWSWLITMLKCYIRNIIMRASRYYS